MSLVDGLKFDISSRVRIFSLVQSRLCKLELTTCTCRSHVPSVKPKDKKTSNAPFPNFDENESVNDTILNNYTKNMLPILYVQVYIAKLIASVKSKSIDPT